MRASPTPIVGLFALVLVATLLPSSSLAQQQSLHLNSTGAFRANITYMTYSAGYGTQIEYLSPSGRSYLWFPGNDSIVPGQWALQQRVVQQQPMTMICFRYGDNTVDFMTGRQGGDWQCSPAVLKTRRVREVASGDIFGLSKRRRVPFILGHEPTTFAMLKRR